MIVGLVDKAHRSYYRCNCCSEQGPVKYWVRILDPVQSANPVTVPYCEECVRWYCMRDETLAAITKLREQGDSPGLICSKLGFKSVADLVAVEDNLKEVIYRGAKNC